MHIIIVGAGRLGASLARWLVSAGHEVAVVERDRPRYDALEEALGGVTVLGDGTDAGDLGKAGANRAEILVATTRRDDINLACCQLATHHFEVAQTISVVNNSDHTELFGLLGIDVTVDVSELVLGRIQEGLSMGGLVRLMPVSDRDGKTLLSIRIPPEAGHRGTANQGHRVAQRHSHILSDNERWRRFHTEREHRDSPRRRSGGCYHRSGGRAAQRPVYPGSG